MSFMCYLERCVTGTTVVSSIIVSRSQLSTPISDSAMRRTFPVGLGCSVLAITLGLAAGFVERQSSVLSPSGWSRSMMDEARGTYGREAKGKGGIDGIVNGVRI